MCLTGGMYLDEDQYLQIKESRARDMFLEAGGAFPPQTRPANFDEEYKWDHYSGLPGVASYEN
jgi:hypothetical protein